MPNIIETVPVPPMFGDVGKENFQHGTNYSLQGASLKKKIKL
jgi:hypothetical protein